MCIILQGSERAGEERAKSFVPPCRRTGSQLFISENLVYKGEKKAKESILKRQHRQWNFLACNSEYPLLQFTDYVPRFYLQAESLIETGSPVSVTSNASALESVNTTGIISRNVETSAGV